MPLPQEFALPTLVPETCVSANRVHVNQLSSPMSSAEQGTVGVGTMDRTVTHGAGVVLHRVVVQRRRRERMRVLLQGTCAGRAPRGRNGPMTLQAKEVDLVNA